MLRHLYLSPLSVETLNLNPLICDVIFLKKLCIKDSVQNYKSQDNLPFKKNVTFVELD